MIKKIFNSGNYPVNIDIALLLLRITIGIFMLTHGIGKFSKLFGDDPLKFADPIGLGITTSLILAVFSEVLCSLFLIIGFVTRLSAIPLLITMLVAVFIIHGIADFGEIEKPLLYTIIYFVIIITGAGKFSIDNLIYRKLK